MPGQNVPRLAVEPERHADEKTAHRYRLDSRGFLEDPGRSGAIGARQAALAEPGAAEVTGHDDHQVAEPGAVDRLQDGGARGPFRLARVVRSLHPLARTPRHG